MKYTMILVILAFAFFATTNCYTVSIWGTPSNNRLQNEAILVEAQQGAVLNQNFTYTVVS